jgi:hypothetical protein
MEEYEIEDQSDFEDEIFWDEDSSLRFCYCCSVFDGDKCSEKTVGYCTQCSYGYCNLNETYNGICNRCNFMCTECFKYMKNEMLDYENRICYICCLEKSKMNILSILENREYDGNHIKFLIKKNKI